MIETEHLKLFNTSDDIYNDLLCLDYTSFLKMSLKISPL